MLVLRDVSPFPAFCRQAIAALGNFDGLHLGHARVVGLAVERAVKAGVPAGVISFEPHPRRFFDPGSPSLRIITLQQKMQLLREMGVKFLRVLRFDRRLADTSAGAFVEHILAGELGLSEIVTGEDFVFGRAREGTASSLAAMAAACGIASVACPAVSVGELRCSSTRVRTALQAGDMEDAVRQLGRPYTLKRPVLHGDKRGRLLGFPTANLSLPNLFLPAFGVYAVRATLHGQRLKGVANLGLRPTFTGKEPRLEVHLFDWDKDIYGESLKVELVHRLRGEQAFANIDTLIAQIASDADEAKKLLL